MILWMIDRYLRNASDAMECGHSYRTTHILNIFCVRNDPKKGGQQASKKLLKIVQIKDLQNFVLQLCHLWNFVSLDEMGDNQI